ncbi:MAG: helix-turn-helix transcriptional regulator [Telmatospirillum sp.]|nr:helix-turn-helix transcriptional regulator [Telmatospirillum sp.]
MTARQAEIASLIVNGHSGKEIGRLLGISPSTVAVHRRAIFLLMAVHSAAQLCLKARAFAGPPTITEGYRAGEEPAKVVLSSVKDN